MRVLAFGFFLLSLPAVAMAAPVHKPDGFDADLVQHDRPRLTLPGEILYGSAADFRDANSSIFDLGPEQAPAASGIFLGPIHAESEIVNGRRRMHYRIDSFTVMGGEIGGSLNHGGAILTLHWGD